MPGARAQRCVFKERGIRCTRNGTGEPPLCRAHAIVFADEARNAKRSAFQRVLDALASGKTPRREDMDRATIDLLNGIFSGAQPGGPFRPPDGFRPPPGWMPPQARPDPKELERKQARATLGFAPNEALSVEVIKQRKRELAKRHHPDAGGSAAQMAKINNAADVLLEAT